jgi:hypothetical protein
VDAFVNILLLSSVKSIPEDALEAEILTHFITRVGGIVKTAVELNKIVGQEITSCELLTIYCEPGAEFEASSMEDAFKSEETRPVTEGSGGGGEEVLCTTELGLLKAEKILGSERQWTKTIVVKPKVALLSGVPDSSSSLGSG